MGTAKKAAPAPYYIKWTTGHVIGIEVPFGNSPPTEPDPRAFPEKGMGRAGRAAAIGAAAAVGAAGILAVKRPSWRQSELDVGKSHSEYEAQKSFINGKEVPYGTKGSSRPDYYRQGSSIEVKNYTVTTSSGRSALAKNISRQVNQRTAKLPEGTVQTVVVDIRGQNVTNTILRELKNSILDLCNTDIIIQFMR